MVFAVADGIESPPISPEMKLSLTKPAGEPEYSLNIIEYELNTTCLVNIEVKSVQLSSF